VRTVRIGPIKYGRTYGVRCLPRQEAPVSIQFDVNNRVATIWMDNEILHANVSLDIGPINSSYGALSFSSGANAKSYIWIDDVEVNFLDSGPGAQSQDSERRSMETFILR
jgi:hypothetical protein